MRNSIFKILSFCKAPRGTYKLYEMCISKICSLQRGEKKRKAEQKVQLKRTDQEFALTYRSYAEN